MTIHTLKNLSVTYLAEIFNAAFADYIVPFRLTEADLQAKMISENIDPENSVGVFHEGNLAGFMLIGTDIFNNELIAYNAGTGVIPEFRGQRLTQKMYDFLFLNLQQKGIYKHQLEVITKNEKAISAYKKIGFQPLRLLSCFKGHVIPSGKTALFTITPIDFPDETTISAFRNQYPAYQNSSSTIKRNLSQHQCFGASAENTLVGYIVFSPANFRIKQFGVHPDFRNKGIGKSLFQKVQQAAADKTLSIINLDDSDKGTMDFLTKIGFETTVQQYEMGMGIN